MSNKITGLFICLIVVLSAGPGYASAAGSIKNASFNSLKVSLNRDPDVLVPPTQGNQEAKESFADKSPEARPRLILALGGGAFKSVAQVGVLQ